jgi:hypothetical protein
MYSEQFGFGINTEFNPSSGEAGAVAFDYRSHPADLESLLSAAIGHQQILHGVAGVNPKKSNEDDMSEEYDDIDDDEYEDDDEHVNGDDSSQGELDE